jgi:hypothetical protein
MSSDPESQRLNSVWYPGTFVEDKHDKSGGLHSNLVVLIDCVMSVPRMVVEKAHESLGVGELEGGSFEVMLDFVANLGTSLCEGERLAADVDKGVVINTGITGGDVQSAAWFDDVNAALSDRVGSSSIQNEFVDL